MEERIIKLERENARLRAALIGEKELYTVGESASLLNKSIESIYVWIRNGRIDSRRSETNRILIPYSEIKRLRNK